MVKQETLTIGIPIDAALKPERTGVEEYTFQLISHFLKTAAEASRYRFILYSSFPPERVREVFPGAEQNATIVASPYKRFWSQRVLPRLLAHTPPDIFFSPANPLPKNFTRLNIPGVVTIHGMEWHNFPKHYSLAQRLGLRFQTKKVLENARGVIAVSAHTKKGIEDFFGKQTPPIAVISHGVEIPARLPRGSGLPRSREDPTPLAHRKHWRILFVGRKDKRKNLKGMVEALTLVRRFAPDVQFTFSAVGPLGNDPFAKKCHKTTPDIFVSGEEKAKHYEQADIFLFPSHDEGFGMPILEAQARGIPVVCSSFLKEIAGEGALYCEPHDPKTITSAVLTLMLHPAVYVKIKNAAKANAKRFSWEQSAKDTLVFIEKVYESKDFAF